MTRRRDRVRAAAGRVKRAAEARLTSSQVSPAPPDETKSSDGLLDSRLFDHDWYNLRVGANRARQAALVHYRNRGVPQGFSPHPLFDPQFFISRLSDEQRAELGDGDPLAFYLRKRLYSVRTHPLFETRLYLQRHPEARKHLGGPLAHYVEVGAPSGLRANRWLVEDDRGLDLTQWLVERQREWAARRPGRMPRRVTEDYDHEAERAYLVAHASDEPAVADRPDDGSTLTIIIDTGFDLEPLAATLAGIRDQTFRDWEVRLVVRSDADAARTAVEAALGQEVASVHAWNDATPGAAYDDAARAARGGLLAYVTSGDRWVPERLERCVMALSGGADLCVDILREEKADGSRRFYVWVPTGWHPAPRAGLDPGRAVIGRDAYLEAGGVDRDMLGYYFDDLLVRLCKREHVVAVPALGILRSNPDRGEAYRRPGRDAPVVQHDKVSTWADVSLNKHRVDWADLARRSQHQNTVSVIIPTYEDYELTGAAVRSVRAAASASDIEVDCIVVDNGSNPTVSAVLDSFTDRLGCRVVHNEVNFGFALGNNLGLPHARGEIVMFLNNDTTVPEGWLEPVVAALQGPDVLGVQNLLLYPAGSVQSAGVAFPAHGGLPHELLQNFPAEDAAPVAGLQLNAVTGAALAVRWADVVALRGFDPLFRNGMEDIDLCHRLQAMRPGHFRVLTEAPVVHHESRTPGRYERSMDNRRLYLDRWERVVEPRDDVDLYAECGYDVIAHSVSPLKEWHEPRLIAALPTVRRRRLEITESAPRLRWALKNPAPGGPAGDEWGDTHFAAAVAAALRARGQEVVIDRRDDFERVTSRHDDVCLVLRGLAPFRASAEQISVCWLISHPDWFPRAEAATYDVVAAASRTWAREHEARWRMPIEPLLQATDPTLFHPDLATPDTGHPVIFVGSSRKQYRPIVKDAVEAGLPLSLYGRLWEPLVPKRFIKAPYLDNGTLGAAYRSAGVVLNDHWDDMRRDGFLSNRLFDAVASGARVVSDEIEGMGSMFGDSVQIYRTPEDLVRLTSLSDPDAVFGDDDTRRTVAATVGKDHAFTSRAERLIELVAAARHRRGFST